MILGAEACIWSETVDPTVLDGLMWPRAAALGEILWSGLGGKSRDQTEPVMRLVEQRASAACRSSTTAAILLSGRDNKA